MAQGGMDIPCPYCGAMAHRLAPVEGTKWRYICPLCHKVFIVDEATGEIVK
ncbi:MAG: zinc ribbon domain-containing protein [Anaerovoracaceae bacterium]|jgi:transposase-like protein